MITGPHLSHFTEGRSRVKRSTRRRLTRGVLYAVFVAVALFAAALVTLGTMPVCRE